LVDITAGADRRIASGPPTSEASSSTLPILRKSVETALWTATLSVIGIGVLDQILRRVRGAAAILANFPSVNLDDEMSLPAWYSSMLMAASAILILAVASSLRRTDDATCHRWRALAVVFLYLSIDESIAIHERLFPPLHNAFGFTGFLYFGWVVVAAPLLVIAALYFLPLVTRLPPPLRRPLVISGAVFVAGAFGMELVGGYIYSTGLGKVPYIFAVIGEESLEMIGLTLFLLALFDLLASSRPPAAFRFLAGPGG
jgi:hypothetical protein